MATRPTAAFARLQAANNNAYDPDTNPAGLAEGGHRQNFVPDLGAVADVGEYVEDLAIEVEADKVQTGEDRVATAADRVQTGQDRTAAATSATDAAASAAKLVATSATSLAIGTGSKVFTTQAGKAFGVGSRLTITNDAAPSTRIMYGTVTAYSGASLTVSVDNVVGSGTYAAWTLRLSGDRGAQGLQGNTGAAGDPNTSFVYALNMHFGS